MNPSKAFEEILKWGVENDDNRKKVIKKSQQMIKFMEDTLGKEVSTEEISKISGNVECKHYT